MAAEPIRRLVPAVVALTWALAASAHAPQDTPSVPLAKPSRVVAKAVPTHTWNDGTARRGLFLEPGLEVDFGTSAGPEAPIAVRRAGTASTKAAAFVSPVLRDEAGRLRALPGGVIVVLRDATDEAAARALLGRAGVKPSRRLTDTTWLIEGPIGLGSLELANRLNDGGGFASAQPNWWVQRTLK
jgi:hypothetical protein